jgi:hypothetical protein
VHWLGVVVRVAAKVAFLCHQRVFGYWYSPAQGEEQEECRSKMALAATTMAARHLTIGAPDSHPQVWLN